MSGTHGELFTEIGALVVAAHRGQPIDLTQTSEELARSYANLNVPAATIERAIARSMGAVGISMEIVQPDTNRAAGQVEGEKRDPDEDGEGAPALLGERSAAGLFPSGVRLAVLS